MNFSEQKTKDEACTRSTTGDETALVVGKPDEIQDQRCFISARGDHFNGTVEEYNR